MNKLFKLPFYIIGTFIYFLTYFIKKDENLWLFGAWFGEKYSDNSKYLFEYMLENHQEKKVYWITKNKKLYKKLIKEKKPVLYFKSLKGIFFILKAKVFIMSSGFEDIGSKFLINNDSLRIQLWHGIGNKKIGYNTKSRYSGTKYENIKKIFFPYLLNYRYSLVISTSELMRKRFSTSFNIDEKYVPITGYPRNDIFFKKRYINNSHYRILYAPTHRKQGKVKESNMLYIPSEKELIKINNFSKQHNIQFFIKLHFYDRDKLPQNMNYSNIFVIEDTLDFDIQEELLKTDLLITDYSSIYFDYLLLDRPVIFSAFDLEEYEREDQGIYEPLGKIAAGPIAKSWDEVLEWITKLKENPELYKEEREVIKNRFHKYQDGRSCERVYKEIIKINV